VGEAAEQLVREAMAVSVRPWGVILGESFGSSFGRVLEDGVEAVVAGLGDGGEGREALAVALVGVLFGRGDVPPEWWGTPLGLAVGPHLPDAGLTQAEAAAILGVRRGTVGTRVCRGNLAQFGPSPGGRAGRPSAMGQVSRKAVLREVAARSTGRVPGVMTEERLAAARAARKKGVPYSMIAKDLGVGRSTVHRAVAAAEERERSEGISGLPTDSAKPVAEPCPTRRLDL